MKYRWRIHRNHRESVRQTIGERAVLETAEVELRLSDSEQERV